MNTAIINKGPYTPLPSAALSLFWEMGSRTRLLLLFVLHLRFSQGCHNHQTCSVYGVSPCNISRLTNKVNIHKCIFFFMKCIPYSNSINSNKICVSLKASNFKFDITNVTCKFDLIVNYNWFLSVVFDWKWKVVEINEMKMKIYLHLPYCWEPSERVFWEGCDLVLL